MIENKDKIKEELWCEALKNGHTMKYRALGHSMSPFIKSGSILTVKSGKKVYIGDVILCRTGDSLFAHRVIARKRINGELIYITKGDNLDDLDPKMNSQNILGKVVAVEHGGKTDCMFSSQRRVGNYLIAFISGSLLSYALFIVRKVLSFKRTTRRVANVN